MTRYVALLRGIAPALPHNSHAELRAVIGPNSRHVALIEDAFKVLVEAPGGGVSVNGGARDRTDARQVIEDLAKRAALGAEVTEADVRAALGQARGGRGTPGMAAAACRSPNPAKVANPVCPHLLESAISIKNFVLLFRFGIAEIRWSKNASSD